MDELFLELVGQIILSTEEDHATLGDCDALAHWFVDDDWWTCW